jgi:negative regulator of genetic competence, sporulation and motility
MLHGLSDEQIDTLVVQLKLIKESGFLKSDVWDNPERIKKEFFWRA